MSEEEKDSQDTNSSVSGESNEVQSTGTSSNTSNANRNSDKRRTNNVEITDLQIIEYLLNWTRLLRALHRTSAEF